MRELTPETFTQATAEQKSGMFEWLRARALDPENPEWFKAGLAMYEINRLLDGLRATRSATESLKVGRCANEGVCECDLPACLYPGSPCVAKSSAPSSTETIQLDRDFWRDQGIEACMDRMHLMGDQLADYRRIAYAAEAEAISLRSASEARSDRAEKAEKLLLWLVQNIDPVELEAVVGGPCVTIGEAIDRIAAKSGTPDGTATK